MRPLPAWLRTPHDYLTDITYILSAITITLMGVIYCMEVVLRYFFNAPTRWSSETVANLMLVTIFLALPHAVRSLNHVAVTLIFDLYPTRARLFGALINVAGIVLCGFVTWLSCSENLRQFMGSIETVANFPIPKWWTSIWITYGFGSSTLWYLRLLSEPGPVRPRLAIIQASTGQGATQ
jgi:TRAP-type C4-dicarboxylate transport system permease small subunit